MIGKNGFMLDRAGPLKLRLMAQRVGPWLRALDGIDRVMVDLAIRVADRACSPVLARVLFSVVNRLKQTSENNLSWTPKEAGFTLTRRLSSLAQRWGSIHARKWAFDISLARFLAIMKTDGFGVFDR
jgi:hypothetical protein